MFYTAYRFFTKPTTIASVHIYGTLGLIWGLTSTKTPKTAITVPSNATEVDLFRNAQFRDGVAARCGTVAEWTFYGLAWGTATALFLPLGVVPPILFGTQWYTMHNALNQHRAAEETRIALERQQRPKREHKTSGWIYE